MEFTVHFSLSYKFYLYVTLEEAQFIPMVVTYIADENILTMAFSLRTLCN